MSEFDPAELAKLAAEATPGGWEIDQARGWAWWSIEAPASDGHPDYTRSVADRASETDAEFIAYVGTHRDAIVAAVSRAEVAEAALARVRELVLCNAEVPGTYAEAMADVWRYLAAVRGDAT